MVPACNLNRNDLFVWNGRVYRFERVVTEPRFDDNGKQWDAVQNTVVWEIGNVGENSMIQLHPQSMEQHFNPYTEVRQVVLLIQPLT